MTVTLETCPKCGYVRSGRETNPDWQCPACGVAYRKYAAYLARMEARLAPRSPATGVPGLAGDASLWTLVGANLLTLVLAFVFSWQLYDLMAVYWAQSVIIGVSYVSRVLKLESFSTEGFRINNRAVAPTAATKRQTAGFFALHFGFFHVVYLVFILAETGPGILFELGFVACAVAFGFNHLYSYRYHRELDRQGTPNIGKLMFTPYARIVPMHLTIIFGATMAGGPGLLLFGVLKTAADLVMHVLEHRALRK